MADPFPFVKVTAEDERILGKRDPDTRVYRREGTAGEAGPWFDKLQDVVDGTGLVSPGGVCMYSKTSRAAVYKAINEGRLTAFGFHVLTESRSVFGFKRKVRELPYVYVPVSEAKAWGAIVAAKVAARQLTREEEPGWVDDRTYYKLEDGILKGKYPKKKKPGP